MTLLERLPLETDRSYALRTIRKNIIDLDLAPGSQISENELAAQMGLSRTPVREAIMELARVKIIKVVPQKRGTIAMIDYDMVEEAQFMRYTLECAVVELVCEMITPDSLLRLEENVQLQQFYMQNRHYQNIYELDDRFHELLFGVAQKTQIYALMQNLLIHFDRVRFMALEAVKDIKIVQDHVHILDAIKKRDSAEARRLMEMHLRRYKFDARAIQEQFPQYIEKKV